MNPARINSYRLWKLELPTGRPIGDCTCCYEALDCVALALETDCGVTGWGFGETVSRGKFAKPAPWITPMASLAEINAEFERSIWPQIHDHNPYSLWMHRPTLFAGFGYLPAAVRIAFWDLMAKLAELPLHRFLGSEELNPRVRAYGSGLDFPLEEERALEIFRGFVARGFRAVKVKVGHPDRNRDLRRLQAVREAVGEGIEIAIDANEAWTCDEAIDRITFFLHAGVRLAYVEDPLSRTDLDGFARLSKSVAVDIAGHDYIQSAAELRRFVERGAFRRLRVPAHPDQWQACGDIATDFDIRLILGNSLFEMGVHAAAALPFVDRIEFSDLNWNLLPEHPVQFENGYAIAPSRPGHGLDPNAEWLERLSRPEAS